MRYGYCNDITDSMYQRCFGLNFGTFIDTSLLKYKFLSKFKVLFLLLLNINFISWI